MRSLRTPLCRTTASCRGLGSLLTGFLLPSDKTCAVVCLDPSQLLSRSCPSAGGSQTRAGGAQDRATAEAHLGAVPPPRPPGSLHHRWAPMCGSCCWSAGWCFASGHICSARDRQARVVNFTGTTARAGLGGATDVKQKRRKPSPKGLDLPQM